MKDEDDVAAIADDVHNIRDTFWYHFVHLGSNCVPVQAVCKMIHAKNAKKNETISTI